VENTATQQNEFNQNAHNIIEDAVKQILVSVGENPQRDGLIKTPYRVAKMYEELMSGYSTKLTTIINNALYDLDYKSQEMVLIENIEYDSMCEHHMLPFSGMAHIAYIPNDKIIGLSKIPRIVEMFARRLQVQERMSHQIADAIVSVLDPKGVIVQLEGSHSCASLRGVKKHALNMKTVVTRGSFSKDRELKNEFYRSIDSTMRSK